MDQKAHTEKIIQLFSILSTGLDFLIFFGLSD